MGNSPNHTQYSLVSWRTKHCHCYVTTLFGAEGFWDQRLLQIPHESEFLLSWLHPLRNSAANGKFKAAENEAVLSINKTKSCFFLKKTMLPGGSGTKSHCPEEAFCRLGIIKLEMPLQWLITQTSLGIITRLHKPFYLECSADLALSCLYRFVLWVSFFIIPVSLKAEQPGESLCQKAKEWVLNCCQLWRKERLGGWSPFPYVK